MKPHLRPLKLAVLSTAALLLLGAALAAFAMFDQALGWDIFGSQVEAVLGGVLMVSVAMAAFGVGLTVVLGLHEIATAMRSLADERRPDSTPHRDAPPRAYLRPMLIVGVAFATVVAALSVVDHEVRRHRDRVFRRLAAEQLERFGPRIGREAARLPLVSGEDQPAGQGLADLLISLEALSFVADVQVVMIDPDDEHALWCFTAAYNGKHRLEHIYVAKDQERAVVRALAGDRALLEQLDAETPFAAHAVAYDEAGTPRAVVRVEANRDEDFRDYRLGSD
jgi:hypothetical protein